MNNPHTLGVCCIFFPHNRPVKSKWDDEEDFQSDTNRQIKVEPGLEREESEERNGEYEESNGEGRKRKHPQQQRRRQQREEGHQPVQGVKEEPGTRSRRDSSNSTTASENGR